MQKDHDVCMPAKQPIMQTRHAKSYSSSRLRNENEELRAEVALLKARLERQSEETTIWRIKYMKAEENRSLETMRLEKRISELEKTLEDVRATLKWFQKEKFTGTSEQTDVKEVSDLKPENSKPRGKRVGSSGHGRNPQDGLFTEVNEIDVPVSNRTCKCCGKPYRLLPKRDQSTIVELMQELFKIIDLGSTYVKDCDCPETESTPAMVRSAAAPRVFPRALYGPNLWTDILVEKFLFQKPLYRIALKYQMLGAKVSVSTMSTGMSKIDELVGQLYESIKNHARGSPQWNMDETTWRVFGESAQKNSNRWWLWVVVTPHCCLYMLDPTRSSALPNTFFQGVTEGTLITDRYSAYKALTGNIEKAFCWSHVRRDFLKVRDGVPSLKTWAESWVKLIDELFAANAERTKAVVPGEKTDEQVFATKYRVTFVTEKIEERLNAELSSNLKERQRRVLSSLRRHWEGLTVFVKNPLIPMDNNAAERALRNPVVGRKNYYGSGSQASGHFASKMFTILQTWLHNGLDPIEMLRDFLIQCAQNRGKSPPAEDYLPWSMPEFRKLEFQLRRTRVKV